MQRGKKVNSVLLGAFIFTGVVIFLLFIFFAGKFSFALGGGYKLRLEYSFLDNLQVGAKVRISGGPAVGYVGKINFENGKIMVDAMMEGDYKINRGARFLVYSTSLVGQKYINISDYVPSATDCYTNNETIQGVTPMGYTRLLELAGNGIQTLLASSNAEGAVKAQDIVRNVAELLEGLNHLINDNQGEIQQSLDSLSATMKASTELVVRVNRTVSNLELSSRRLDNAMKSFDPAQVGTIISNVDSASADLKDLMEEFNRLSEDKNSAISLLRDRDFKTRLENTMRNFEIFSEKIKNNPNALIWGGGGTNTQKKK